MGSKDTYNKFIQNALPVVNENSEGVAKQLIEHHRNTRNEDLKFKLSNMSTNRAIDNHYAENLYASLGLLMKKSRSNLKGVYADEDKVHLMNDADAQEDGYGVHFYK